MRNDLFSVHEMVFDKAGKRNYWIIYPEPKVGYMRSGSIFLRFLQRYWKFFLIPINTTSSYWPTEIVLRSLFAKSGREYHSWIEHDLAILNIQRSVAEPAYADQLF